MRSLSQNELPLTDDQLKADFAMLCAATLGLPLYQSPDGDVTICRQTGVDECLVSTTFAAVFGGQRCAVEVAAGSLETVFRFE